MQGSNALDRVFEAQAGFVLESMYVREVRTIYGNEDRYEAWVFALLLHA